MDLGLLLPFVMKLVKSHPLTVICYLEENRTGNPYK